MRESPLHTLTGYGFLAARDWFGRAQEISTAATGVVLSVTSVTASGATERLDIYLAIRAFQPCLQPTTSP